METPSTVIVETAGPIGRITLNAPGYDTVLVQGISDTGEIVATANRSNGPRSGSYRREAITKAKSATWPMSSSCFER